MIAGPVPDAVVLYRRVDRRLLKESAGGCIRVTSAAFKQDPELSVVLGDQLAEDGRPPETTLERWPGQYLISFLARDVRSTKPPLDVVRSPTEEEPAHGDVIGRKTGAVIKALHEAAAWALAPPGACSRPSGRGA